MSLFVFAAVVEYNRSYQNSVNKVQEDLYKIKTNLENLIASRVISVNGLKSHVEIHPDLTQTEFNYFSKGIYDSSDSSLLRIYFITDTTVTHIYPYEENKEYIGIDLIDHEDKKIWINEVKYGLKTLIVSKANLFDGGEGILILVPVIRENVYFGQVSIVFDYDKVIETSNLLSFSNYNYVELSKSNELLNQDTSIWTTYPEDIIRNNKYVTAKVNLYETEMTLQATPRKGLDGKSNLFYFLLAVGGLISLVFSLVDYKLLKTTGALSKSEIELEEKNINLRQMVSQLNMQYEEIIKQKKYIQYLADHDDLTNIYNRRKFIKDITYHIKSQNKGSVLFFDIDNFKSINDTQGHRYGDKVLNHIASILSNFTSQETVIYRIGGDKFAIHIPNVIENEKIENLLKSIFKAIRDNSTVDQIKIHITSSVGIAKYPIDSTSTDDILMKSDIAMYQAKEDGKNRFCYFSEELVSKFDYIVKIERELQNAIETDNFRMLYQPVINTKTGNIDYFEALLRINNSNLSPAEFIPIAENSGLIGLIGNIVIYKVCKQLSSWRESGLKIKPVAINISPTQFCDGSILECIESNLNRYNLEARYLELEVTENVLIGNTEYTIEILNKLRDLGLLISLDDFGTGYSSLSYLSYIPVNKVKIDKSLKDKFLFLENVEFMEGLISVCHGLNLKVVTEGVETFEEYDKLRTIESDYVQGYYFEKPISPDKAALIIEKNYLNNES